MSNVRQIVISSPKYGQKICVIDTEYYDRVIHLKWKLTRRRHNYYAQAWDNNSGSTIMMHRLIAGIHVGDKRVVDHINGNSLDNRRANLRACTNQQNCWNRRVSSNNSTGYRGVTKRPGGYAARIRVNDELIYIKWSTDPKIAAHAYNEAAIKYYGEFARLNKI